MTSVPAEMEGSSYLRRGRPWPGGPVKFRVLGPLEVTGAVGTTGFGGRREGALLARLLFSANRVVSAERLVDDLWGSDPPGDASGALQVCVSRLRRALRGCGLDDVLVTRPPGYVLEVEPDAFDVACFDSLVGRGREESAREDHRAAAETLRSALALWRGSALADVGDAPFARVEAARLEEGRLAALEERIEADLACGRHQELIGELTALVAEHPLRERLWSQRMLALYRAGRQAEALRTYQDLGRILGEELGIAPSAALRKLEGAILRHEPELDWSGGSGPEESPGESARPDEFRPHGNHPGRLTRSVRPERERAEAVHRLVGRVEELHELKGSLQTAAGGAGRVVIIEGEPGIGKTRLVGEALECAKRLGFQVFSGASEELECRRPFGPMADGLAIDPQATGRRAEIAQLLFGQPPEAVGSPFLLDTPQAEFRLVEAFLALVDDFCQEAPVVLAIEDLQWSDPSTLLVLHRLGRHIARLPALLVATCRPLPRRPEVQQLLDSLMLRGAIRLLLGPLEGDAATELAQELLEAPLGPNLVRQIRRTGGNPLFVIELVEALKGGGAIKWDREARAEVETVDLPPSLTLTILRRLSFLSQRTLELLRIASVLGHGFAVPELSLLLGEPAIELAEPFRESVSAGVLREEAHRFAFDHDLIREALYQDVPLPVRTALHRDAARALAGAGAPPVRVAEHLLRGAAPGDPQAVEWLHEAARQTAHQAPGVAVELLERALEVAGPAHPRRDLFLAEQALSLVWAGRVLEAQAMCREMLGRARDPAAEITFRTCLVQTLISTERYEEVVEEAAAALAAPTLPASERLVFRGWLAVGRLLLGHLEEAARVAEEARAVAEAAGDALAQCIAVGVLAGTRYFRGDFAEAIRFADQAASIADRASGHGAHRFPINVIRGMVLVDLDRTEDAHAAIRRGRRVAEEIGVGAMLVPYHWVSAQALFLWGRWDDSQAECDAGQELAEEMGLRVGTLSMHTLRAIIYLHRGLLEEAEAALEAAEENLRQAGFYQLGLDWMMWARGLLLEALGQRQAAFSVMSNAWALCGAAGLTSEYRIIGPDVVRLALAAGEATLAEEATEAIEALAERNPGLPTLAGAALRCRGLLHDDPETLERAVASYRKSPRPLELALTCEDAGAAFARAGRKAEARTLLEEALTQYEFLGAARDAARAAGLLRSSGFSRGKRGGRRRPASGWQSLTESELKVVELVSRGLSNPQIAERLFLSRHTVHTHVSHALAKLGTSTRAELAAEAIRRGL